MAEPLDLFPPCPLCLATGLMYRPGFATETVLRTCELCKGRKFLYRTPEELTAEVLELRAQIALLRPNPIEQMRERQRRAAAARG